MAADRDALEAMARDQLVAEARRLGVRRPEVMTRVELVDEVLRLSTPNPVERKQVRGWLGIARDLVASLVEQGLNLPDAAALIRGDVRFEPLHPPQPPVATVTLAEIYGAQGHFDRALVILDEVLAREPDHDVAQKLRKRLARERDAKRAAERERRIAEREPLRAAPGRAKSPPPPTEFPPEESGVEALAPDEDADGTHPTLPPEPEHPTLPPEPEHATLPPEPEPTTARRPILPKRFADDAAVLAWTAPSRVALYYELGAREGESPSFVARIVELRPRPGGAERAVHERAVAGASGSVSVDGIEPGAVVRAALGVVRGSNFVPLAVAPEMRLSEDSADVTWAPRRQDYRDLAARAAAALAARE
jgi:hypothetical protein